jgi:hypothetical protein
MKTQPLFEFLNYRPIRRFRLAAIIALCLALVLPLRGSAQNAPGSVPHTPFQQPIGQPVGGGLSDIPNGSPIDDEKLLRALNADRQKSLVSDTNKLLKLVNELNAEVARTNPESLTPSQLHKVAEIEKLAHNVKDKMSTSVRGSPPFRQPMVHMR